MLSRVADDLFWMGRYVERAVAVSRLLEVTQHLELDAGTEDFWRPLMTGANGAAADIRYWLTSAEDNPDALVSCARRVRSLARVVRESISSEMWEEANGLYLSIVQPSTSRSASGIVGFHRQVRDRLQRIQGLADATLAHDEPWHFISLGTYLERAASVSRLLRQREQLLTGTAGDEDTRAVKWLAVLRSCGSAEAYARYYTLRVEPPRIVEFLVLNPVFPQSVRYSVTTAAAALGSIAALREVAGNDPGPAPRTLGRVRALVEHTTVD